MILINLNHQTFVGGPGNDFHELGDGDDYLAGGGGDDTLVGGTGNDSIYGDCLVTRW